MVFSLESDLSIPNEAVYDAITQNPWDEKMTALLLEKVKDRRRPYKDDNLPCCVPAAAYREMVAEMQAAETIEEKQRLLATEAPILKAYADRHRPYEKLYWDDVVQGFRHNVRPPKVEADPFLERPDSVYKAIGTVLGRSDFNFGLGLDLGSGSGETTRNLAANCDQAIGVDRFPFWHSIAQERDQERGLTNIEYETAHIPEERVPLDDHLADVIISNGLTAFIPPDKLKAYIEEITRLLAPGGSYFEPEVTPDGMLARAIKRELCWDIKGLLAYLIGKLVSSPEKGKSGRYPHSTTDFDGRFRAAGYKIREYGSVSEGYYTGVSVVRFTAPF